MELLLQRRFRGPKYTIGTLYINGERFCDTLEDVDRGLSCKLREAENIRLKIAGATAIPVGTYHITLDQVSSKFRYKSWAQPYGGRLPRLLSVPAFTGVLIHPGNTAADTEGCLLVGENKAVGQVINSVATFHKLMPILLAAKDEITITIQ